MNAPLSLEAWVRQAENQVSCDLEGEAAILDMKSGIYYGLNPVGARIWDLLQRPRMVADIVETLGPGYAVPRETLQADVLRLLEELRQRGLVTVGGGAPTQATPSLT